MELLISIFGWTIFTIIWTITILTPILTLLGLILGIRHLIRQYNPRTLQFKREVQAIVTDFSNLPLYSDILYLSRLRIYANHKVKENAIATSIDNGQASFLHSITLNQSLIPSHMLRFVVGHELAHNIGNNVIRPNPTLSATWERIWSAHSGWFESLPFANWNSTEGFCTALSIWSMGLDTPEIISEFFSILAAQH